MKPVVPPQVRSPQTIESEVSSPRFIDRAWWVRSSVGASGWALVLSLIVVAVDGSSPTNVRVLTTFLIYLVVALGLQTFSGLSGIISFAHIGFMALGAYAGALFSTSTAIKLTEIPQAPHFLVHAQLGFWPSTALAIVVVMLAALVIGIPLVRLDGAPAAVATIGVLVIINAVLSNLGSVTRGAQAFYGIPIATTLYVALAVAVIALVAARLFRDSNVGLGLRSSRLDVLGPAASGVHVARARLIAWTLSAGIAAAGGSLYAHYLGTLLPGEFLYDLTLTILTMIIIGGPTVSGAVVGAMIVTLATEFLRRAENSFSVPGLSTVVLGVLILATLIVRPSGLLGRWEADQWLRHRWKRSRSKRATGEGDRPGPGENAPLPRNHATEVAGPEGPARATSATEWRS